MIALFGLLAVFSALWAATYAFLPPVLRGVRRFAALLARWLRGFARLGPLFGRLDTLRAYFPLALAFAIGAVVIVSTADAFTDLAAALRDHDPAVQRIDEAVHAWAGARRTPGLTAFFVALTTAGGPAAMTGVVAIVSVVLVARRRFRWASYLVITSAGGALLDQLLKLHYLRQRPDMKAAVTGAMGYSFPSGHAMGATIVLGALAYLAARSVRGWGNECAALAGLATLALGIGISRIYLGVHWSSDVGAGFVAGLLWVAATTTGYEVFRQYRLGSAARAARPEVESRS